MSTLKVDTITDAAGTGAPDFSQGVTLPTSGGTPTTLDFYEEYTHSSTWTASSDAVTSGSINLAIVRIGNIVTITTSAAITCSGNCSSSTSIDIDTPLPSRFTPASNTHVLIPRIIKAGTAQTTAGHMALFSSGSMSLSSVAGGSATWGASSSNGTQNKVSFTYNIS